MRIAGAFFDGTTSRRRAAVLEVGDDTSLAVVVDGERVRTGQWRDADVATRVGDTPRMIRFADGAAFETTDNAAVDAVLARFGAAPVARLVHRLESAWRVTLATLLVVAGITYGMAVWGVPFLAARMAASVPPSLERAISHHALATLDGSMLKPTGLDPPTQERLRARLATLVAELTPRPAVTLALRASPRVGPNAFALPSGDIVVTDELVRFALNDDEIVAVLAHEVGHVVHRHGLRQVLQASAVALVLASVTNDAGAVTSIAAGLPTVLLQSGYSRGFEREADSFALELLRARGIDPGHFANIIERLEAKEGGMPSGLGFLSTHPSAADRVAPFRAGPLDPRGGSGRRRAPAWNADARDSSKPSDSCRLL